MDNNKITERFGKDLIKEYVSSGKRPSLLAKKHSLLPEAELKNIIKKVIAENQKIVEQIRAGNEKPINYLVGQVLKKGQADPKKIRELILKLI